MKRGGGIEMVFDGRWTGRLPAEGGAVFLIGMRVNNLWRMDKWLPVASAMPRMLTHLGKHPELGFLGGHSWFGRTTMLLSYWRSAEDLINFASAKEAPHLEAWKAYNRAVGAAGTVGVWHETYLVKPGQAEVVYANMPAFGLGAAFTHEKITKNTNSSRKRLVTSGPA
jgi:hypothetical protein